MMNKKGVARTTIVLALMVVILATGLIYYATLPPASPPPGPATITGKITDAETGVAVAGATVAASGYRATTGPDGVYSLSVKVGKYTVTVTMAGYETKTTSVDASEEKTYTVDVALRLMPPPVPEFVKKNTYIHESVNAFQWLDPHVSYYTYDYWIIWHSVEMLLWYNGSSSTEVIPWLAESYKKLSLTQYEFKLRKGIKFHDGTPFNATAVYFSLNRVLIMDGTSGTGEEHGSQAAWIIQQMLNRSLSSYFNPGPPAWFYTPEWVKAVLDQNFVEIVNDYTVRLNIIHPTTQFEYLLSMPWAGIVSPTSVIATEHPEDLAAAKAGDYTPYFERQAGVGLTPFNLPEHGWKIGTGPYTLESVDPVTYRVVMKANPDYWGGPPDFAFPIGKPKIETLEFRTIESFGTRLLDLKAGRASGIGVPPDNIFSVVDRDAWLNKEKFVSIIPGVALYGVFPTPITTWFNFVWNVTTPTGELREFQPFCDWRFRMAVCSAVNLTDIAIHVQYRLWEVAKNVIPPGTAPEGSYDPNITPAYSYNLTRCKELLINAMNNPLTEFTYYNGTRIPPGIVDNSFGPEKPRTIELHYIAGATTEEKIVTTICTNLNRISWENRLGLAFTPVPVVGGQQYTLAALHQIDFYWGGWHADYNHVLNWLGPAYLSTGSYFSWNLINITRLDELYMEAFEADTAGDVERVVEISNEMNRIANEMWLYLLLWHRMDYFCRSTYLKGWYLNPALGLDYFAPMWFEELP